MPAPRAVLLGTGRHTPPGLLSRTAWGLLPGAHVLVAGADHPQLAVLREEGLDVEVVEPADLGARLRQGTADGRDLVALPPPGPVALAEARAAAGPGVEVVPGAQDPPGARLLDVVAVMDRLRSPGGCPWDAAQTHASLRPHLLEEAYEAYAAIEEDDLAGLREELGDVLLQVVFHARLAQERPDGWSVDDVAGDLVDKLVRRHPHVFAGASADDLEGSWDALKAAEKGRTSVTEGVPLGQPALSLAAALQRRAGRLGAPVPAYDGVGGQLWELVRACREAGVDPEEVLRATSRRFRDDLARTERAARADGLEPRELSEQDWAVRWPAAGQ